MVIFSQKSSDQIWWVSLRKILHHARTLALYVRGLRLIHFICHSEALRASGLGFQSTAKMQTKDLSGSSTSNPCTFLALGSHMNEDVFSIHQLGSN